MTEKIVDGEFDAIEKQGTVKDQHLYSTFHGPPARYTPCTSPRYPPLTRCRSARSGRILFQEQQEVTPVGHEADDVVLGELV